MNKNIILLFLAIIIINSCQNKKNADEITKSKEPEYVLKSVSDNPELIELDNLFKKVRNKEIPAVDLIRKCEELLKKENINNKPNELVYVQFQYALALIIENRLKDAETILLKSIELSLSNKIENPNNISVSI